ncbi:MAG: hypothetical protein JWN04_5688 [Myxococcaceae bacterium]|nr:hypothetical protein [Myxococcaceae bacterium]
MSAARRSEPQAGAPWARRKLRALPWLAAYLGIVAGCTEPTVEKTVMLSIDGGSGRADGLDARLSDVSSPQEDASFLGVSDCLGDELVFPIAQSASRAFGAVVDGMQVHLSYLEEGCDGIGLAGDPRGLRYARFSTTGGVESDVELPSPRCASVRSPLLLAQAGSVTAFFATRSERGDELQSSLLSEGGANAERALLVGLGGALAATLFGSAATPLAAYVSDSLDTDAGTAVLSVQGSITSEVLSASAQHHPVALALAALEPGTGLAGAALWVNDRSESAGVYLRMLDDVGAGIGGVVGLSSAIGSRSAVATAARKQGVGIVYSEAPRQDDVHQLRFRQMSLDGSVGEPVALTYGDEDVGHTAIAAYSNGYAIAYRRLGGILNRQAEVRLLFIDPAGNVGGERFVAPTTISGTAVDVRIAGDGRIIVLWDALDLVDTHDAGAGGSAARLHVARLLCL